MARFILNNQLVNAAHLPSGSTILDYVRNTKQLCGTKTGCREGDCGACTVLVGDLKDGKLYYQSMTSCLLPLGNAHGKHILTVEGINMGNELSPVQTAMVETNGTQCGFCTIGFVMSFTGFVMNPKTKNYDQAITAIDGNICRCTGYKSIERAAASIAEKVSGKPASETMAWLVAQGFVPSYFLEIENRLQKLRAELEEPAPKTTNLVMGGGTDLLVQRPEAAKRASVKHIFDNTPLKGISVAGNECVIGATTTVTEFAESEIIRGMFPNLDKHIKWVSSTPIRNMATIGGNFVNASPIGDMTVFFLALDASIQLSNGTDSRQIKLRDFYKGYKQLDKTTDEFIAKISFELPVAGTQFNFEKVCKREYLDIASVNTACQMQYEKSADGQYLITKIHASTGGVGPTPKYLSKTVAFLTGKTLTAENIEQALDIINEEISPISDARGTAEYKRRLLRQLFLGHLIQFFGLTDSIQNSLKK